jgi:DMSO/TMAO reductase YedYZ molybdopterin-dependent catalytic subunit
MAGAGAQADQVQRGDAIVAFSAGVVAAIFATFGMLALGFVLDKPTIAELLAEGIANLTPLAVIERLVQTLGESAKHLLFSAVVLGQIAIGGVLGLVIQRRGLSIPQTIAAIAGVGAAVGLILLPLLGLGALGAGSRAGAIATLSGLLLTGLLYVVGYAAVWRFLNPGGTFAEEDAVSRRTFLRNTALLGGGVILGLSGFRWLAGRLGPPPVPSVASVEASQTTAAVAAAPNLEAAIAAGVPGLSPEITPNDKFYVVSKNFLRDPEVNAQTWRLEVGGLVDRPMTLGYEDMKALPSSSQFFTLQCISNEVGGELIGNADWRGTSLANLLTRAGVKREAFDVVFTADDGYTDSIPIEKAMQPDTMLAYDMNGEPLPQKHGFPVRLLAPDLYGMKNVKWVTKIEVVEYDFKGYWMQRGWTDVSIMHTTSRIDFPKNGSYLRPGVSYVGGVAIAGQRGIQRVEVSTDGGQSWTPAVMKPALGPNAWSLWLHEWQMPEGAETSQYQLVVRATDGTGAVQTATVQETVPDGATGYHTVVVRAATR